MNDEESDNGQVVPCISLSGDFIEGPPWENKAVTTEESYFGEIMSWHIGDTFIHQGMPPCDQWARIVHILRVHGIKFVVKGSP